MRRSLILSLCALALVVGVSLRRTSDPIAPDALVGTQLGVHGTSRWVPVGADQPVPPTVTVTVESPGVQVVTFDLAGFWMADEIVAGRQGSRLTLPGHIPLQEEGLPELPIVTTNLPLEGGGIPTVSVREHRVSRLRIPPVAPSLGHVSRQLDPTTLTPRWSSFYDNDDTWPAEPFVLGAGFELRRQRGVGLRINPLRYRAATGEIEFSEHLVLEIRSVGVAGHDHNLPPPRLADVDFAGVYGQAFARPPEFAAADAGAGVAAHGRGRMVIVAPGEFLPTLRLFATWKRQLGISVELVAVEDLGSDAAGIDQLLRRRYAEPEGLTWVVLAGDRAQVPTNTGTHDGSDADIRYALLAGTDLYPDVFISRISATDKSQLAGQITKFMAYEQRPATGSWYRRAVGVASNEGSPSDAERMEGIRTQLIAGGYDDVIRVYQGAGGTSAGITRAVETGCGLVNYIGHGTETWWTSVPFGVADVLALENTDAWPWVIDVSCSTGRFARGVCLGEAWMRAGDDRRPRGAIAVLASTSDTPWVPPTVMQAEINHEIAEGDLHSLGALTCAGLTRMLSEYAGLPVATQVLEQYVLFGDCSLELRTAAPGTIVVTAPEAIPEGTSEVTVTVRSLRPTRVTLVGDSGIRGMAVATTGGAVTIPIDGPLPAGTRVLLTASAPDMVPWTGSILVGNGPPADPDGEPRPGSWSRPTEPTPTPDAVRLLGNHPNPFNPATTITFELPRGLPVRLMVYDVRGSLVATLVDGSLPAGRHEATWNGRDAAGRAVASGLYLYRLSTPLAEATGRMTLSR